ncbi:hypothetical protein K6Q96_21375 [Grimontia kaedaensis]|uniref:Uncharacterized protein n=1 Tax=Grimontia kaedaensis TaxID=2872157 RepID=A0ABY4WZ68_9GAMM|nr:hypothetical protein [Grimontia kaedaensis]USH04298.1 hypothetical protein K6Q96_21375 [Grimontia kaedaensis]
MKKTLATALLMLAASPFFAANADITVVPVSGGAFVTATQYGQPLEGTKVSQTRTIERRE